MSDRSPEDRSAGWLHDSRYFGPVPATGVLRTSAAGFHVRAITFRKKAGPKGPARCEGRKPPEGNASNAMGGERSTHAAGKFQGSTFQSDRCHIDRASRANPFTRHLSAEVGQRRRTVRRERVVSTLMADNPSINPGRAHPAIVDRFASADVQWPGSPSPLID